MTAFALNKTTGTVEQLAENTPSFIRRHRRTHPDHVVIRAKDTAHLHRTLSLYGV